MVTTFSPSVRLCHYGRNCYYCLLLGYSSQHYGVAIFAYRDSDGPRSTVPEAREAHMILLTGGTGYVGSHLLARLRGRGEPVRVLVRNQAEGQHLATGNVGLAIGDVTNLESLHEAMKGVDTVVHLVGIIRERPGGVTFERIN